MLMWYKRIIELVESLYKETIKKIANRKTWRGELRPKREWKG